MKKYKIWTGGNTEKVMKTLDALFKRGYVFLNRERLRSLKEVTNRWCGFMGWDWVLIGINPDCKAVIDCAVYRNDDYERITLEEFLKLK